MYHRFAGKFHVVAQIIKAQLIISSVGNVATISVLTFLIVHAIGNTANGKAEETVQLAHPFRVALGEVIIHGHNMHAFAWQCIEVGGQRTYQRFTLTRAHFSDHAFMKDNTADHLHIKVAHA